MHFRSRLRAPVGSRVLFRPAPPFAAPPFRQHADACECIFRIILSPDALDVKCCLMLPAGSRREMLMRFALLATLTASMAALAASTPVCGAALAPPAFSIIHAGQLLAVPGK